MGGCDPKRVQEQSILSGLYWNLTMWMEPTIFDMAIIQKMT